MNTASTRTHKFTELMAKATHVSCKISGLLRRRHTIRRSVRLLGDAHALPIDDRRRTPSVLALTKQRLTSQTGPVWTRKHESDRGQRPHTYAANLAVVAANPFAGKVPSSLQIRDLERTSCTHAERSSLIPLWVLCSNSKHSWRKAANSKSLN